MKASHMEAWIITRSHKGAEKTVCPGKFFTDINFKIQNDIFSGTYS